MASGYGVFEFELLPSFTDALEKFIGTLDDAPLVSGNITGVEEAQGVYVLLHRGEVVYVGKADSAKGLRNRLDRHRNYIDHRHNISSADVTFKAVRVMVLAALDVERELIRRWGEIPWNNSGFGANDPGRNRDHTREKPGHFDRQFPIDPEVVDDGYTPGKRTVSDLLREAKRTVPYVLRFAVHDDLKNSTVTVPSSTLSARQVIELVVEALPAGWQFTHLGGRIIGYREAVTSYPSGIQYWRSPGSEGERHGVLRDLDDLRGEPVQRKQRKRK